MSSKTEGLSRMRRAQTAAAKKRTPMGMAEHGFERVSKLRVCLSTIETLARDGAASPRTMKVIQDEARRALDRDPGSVGGSVHDTALVPEVLVRGRIFTPANS